MALPIRRGGGGGGFLNNQAGTFLSYQLQMKTGKITKGDDKGKEYKKVTMKAIILPDGGKPTEQYFDGGFLRGDNGISDDGMSITGKDQFILDGGTELGALIISLVEPVGEGNRPTEDALGDLRSYPFLVNGRFVFTRVKNESETKRRGKRKVKGTDGKTREFDRDNLLIKEVITLGDGKAKPVGVTNGTGKATKATGAKGAATPAPTATVDPSAADAALVAILGANDNALAVEDIAKKFVSYAVKAKLKPAERDGIKALVGSEDYINGAVERGLVTLEDGVVQLVPVEESEAA